ncbi:MAG: response regulator [Deltaproteobacteria bacterium]|nr:response regulator [Deltaproteobacteria bacterium]MBZ0219739.1 response regulator [Deltaproteobacteria bacterium]
MGSGKEGKSGLNILVVEDNPGDLRLLHEMLETGGLDPQSSFSTAGTLNRAIIEVAGNSFDLIILDLGLPDSDGIATFRSMRTHAAGTPIIVLTGLADEALGMRAVKQGAQDYLVKGQIDGRLLYRSIMYAIERSRLELELKKRVEEIERLNRMLHFERDMEVEDLRREIQRLREREKKAG